MNNLFFFLFFLLLGGSAYGENFQQYKQQSNKSYSTYKTSIENQFRNYAKAQNRALQEFKNEIKQVWNKPSMSTQHKWVEYSKDLKSRKSVDFKKQIIKLEVIAKNGGDARTKIGNLFNSLVHEDMGTAYKHDILEHKIGKILKKKSVKKISTQKVIGDCLTKKEKKNIQQNLRTKKLSHHSYKKSIIYTISVKLPSDTMLKKAQSFKHEILIAASKQKIPAELIYAIMQSESSFNPMARSQIPAFGLMQIVPRTAGIDAYNYLYGRKKLLSASYLYAFNRNITIGSAYLHILYYDYLGKIKNPRSRLYCTIAAYNTGSGNVAKTFVGSRNIRLAFVKINKLSSKEVYAVLMNRLPYDETKHYLKIVKNRVYIYKKLLATAL